MLAWVHLEAWFLGPILLHDIVFELCLLLPNHGPLDGDESKVRHKE